MNILLKEDTKYFFNNKYCTFIPGIDKSMFFTNPKGTFAFVDGTESSCIYDLIAGTYTWTGDEIKNGDLVYNGSAWSLDNFTNL